MMEEMTNVFQKLEGQNLREKQGFSMVLYSDPGVGKSSAIGRLPVGRTLIIDVEGGVYVIEKTRHLYMQIRDWSDVEMAKLDYSYMLLKTNGTALGIDFRKINFVVIDSVSELYKWFQFYYLEKSGKKFFNKDIYGKAAQKLREYIRNYRNLTFMGKNIIFTAIQTSLDLSSDGASEVKKMYPHLSETFTREICQLVDLVGHLEIKNTLTQERAIRFADNGIYFAKSRVQEVEEMEGANLTQLFMKIYKCQQEKLGGVNEAVETQTEQSPKVKTST